MLSSVNMWPAWLFVMFLLTGICIVPFTFELFIEFSLISTFAFPNTFPVLLLCISRTSPPPRDNRGNAGSCTSYSLHFSTPVGEVYTSPLSPGELSGGGGVTIVVSGLYFHAAYFATFSSPHAAKKYALQSVLLWLQAESPLITCLIFPRVSDPFV